jgi:DNA-binding beta-propeller fold protein YncE
MRLSPALPLVLAASLAHAATPSPTPTARPRPAAATIALVAGDGLNEPFGTAFDAAGNVYVVEMGGHLVSAVRGDGTRAVLAGTGEKGAGGDGGPAAKAAFNGPHHLVTGPDGALYVADTWNNAVRRIDLATGVVTRTAGTGEKGFAGDGGPALEARFGGIYALAVHGPLLYVCDLDNRRVRAVDTKTGIVTTVAGNGEKGIPQDGEPALGQPLFDPRAIAVDGSGNLYILERNGHALRVVDNAGKIRTVAGTGEAGFSGDGGPAREAQMRGPKHIAVDADDSVLIADSENHVIRRYTPKDGRIRRVAGTSGKGAGGVGGPPEACPLNRPHGVVVHPRTGEIYIADSGNHRVLRIEGGPR